MTKTEFNKLLNKITTHKRVDLSKILLLTDQERSDMVYFIVRNREPVLEKLIPNDFDFEWLTCMGYLYYGKSSITDFEFVCTSEHRIV